jgi:hypothetical protein
MHFDAYAQDELGRLYGHNQFGWVQLIAALAPMFIEGTKQSKGEVQPPALSVQQVSPAVWLGLGLGFVVVVGGLYALVKR